jgi:hypothetical protein
MEIEADRMVNLAVTEEDVAIELEVLRGSAAKSKTIRLPIAARRVEMVDARAASPVLQRNYLAPSYTTAEPARRKPSRYTRNQHKINRAAPYRRLECRHIDRRLG